MLNHTSNSKSGKALNIPYIIPSILTQFYQNFKHPFIKIKVELYQ